MNHSFDIEHAAKYGIHEAILIANFQHWIAKNRANGMHLHEGRTWTYNTVKAFAELFPYLTDNQVRRALDNLVEKKILIAGNFNPSTYDRTKWYAFSAESIWLPEQIHLAKKPNGSGKSAKTVNTNINTDITADINNGAAAHSAYSPADSLIQIGVDPQTASDWLQVRKAKKAASTKTAIDGVLREIAKAGMTPEGGLRICCERGWVGFKAEWVQNTQSRAVSSVGQIPSQAQRDADNRRAKELLFGHQGEVIDV